LLELEARASGHALEPENADVSDGLTEERATAGTNV
jgi:hypothetical protein